MARTQPLTLRVARQLAGLTQVELAAKAAVSQAYISDLELGRRSHPTVMIAYQLEMALDCPLHFPEREAGA